MLALALLVTLSASAPQAEIKKVSLEVQRADVHAVLQMFAELMKTNLVVSDEVQGTVTLKLRNIPVREALDVVLASKGLGMERRGSVIRVASLSRLTEEAQQRAALAKAREDSAPLVTTLVPVNYASAEAMAAQVRPMLSPRGSVSVDARTNTLIIRDVK